MEVRKLEQNEHGKTRALWEDIFVEDTRAFLDYYYEWKTRDNEIYVIEEEEKIRSMLQLNPYELQIEHEVRTGQYVIAVATEEKYRHRGYMAALLKKAMKDRYDKKDPFIFLMPAAEAIYRPFDFRFVYEQNQCRVTGKNRISEEDMEIREASLNDCRELAAFAGEILRQNEYQVYTVRNAYYYETMIKEQKSENGGVMVIKYRGKLVGTFAYAKEEGFEIREPLYLKEHESLFLQAVYQLTGSEEEEVLCLGYGQEERKPVIMARMLHLESLLVCMRAKEDFDCCFTVEDPILEGNRGTFCIQARGGKVSAGKCEACQSQGKFTIAVLTELLFGRVSVSELEQDRNIILEHGLAEALKQILPLRSVFLNEIV